MSYFFLRHVRNQCVQGTEKQGLGPRRVQEWMWNWKHKGTQSFREVTRFLRTDCTWDTTFHTYGWALEEVAEGVVRRLGVEKRTLGVERQIFMKSLRKLCTWRSESWGNHTFREKEEKVKLEGMMKFNAGKENEVKKNASVSKKYSSSWRGYLIMPVQWNG